MRMTAEQNAESSRVRKTLKENPRLLGFLAGFLVLLSQTGVAAAGSGAVTSGP